MTAVERRTPDTDAQAAGGRRRTERGASALVSCGGCGHRWTARGAAHCSGCCGHVGGELATFATARLFDLHRRETGERGRCLDPASVVVRSGMRKGERVMFHRDGMWRGPEMSDEQKATAFGGAR